VYRASDVPFENSDTSISAQAIRHHIQATSSRRLGPERLYHRDRGRYEWEDLFEEALLARGVLMPAVSRASKTSTTTWKPQAPAQSSKPQVQVRAAAYSAASHHRPPAPVANSLAVVKPVPRQYTGSAAASQPAAAQPPGQTASASAWRNPSILRPSTSAAGSSVPATSTSTSNAPIVNLSFGAKQEKELLNLCRKYDIYVRDMREREGNLWVALDKPEDSRMTPLLQAYGFKYRPGRGWWRQA
jgi:hypothetical protein